MGTRGVILSKDISKKAVVVEKVPTISAKGQQTWLRNMERNKRMGTSILGNEVMHNRALLFIKQVWGGI